METGVAYLFAIIFIVIVLNFYFIFSRMKRGNRHKRMGRSAISEAKQALWRDKEVARRIEREQDDAYERVKLRNETLAYYEEVRRRHAIADEADKFQLPSSDYDSFLPEPNTFLPEIDSFLQETETDDKELDPFDIFKKNK